MGIAVRRRLPVVLVAFLAMEPATYAAHRWVMHGVGWVLHRSHHRRRAKALEANDAFPLLFASATIVAVAAGTRRPGLRPLRSVGAGVTLYGAVYGFVHDLYIHARLGRLPRSAALERLKAAHRIHHLFGGEPYGMLFPFVPAELRAREARLGQIGLDGSRAGGEGGGPDLIDRGPRARLGVPPEPAPARTA